MVAYDCHLSACRGTPLNWVRHTTPTHAEGQEGHLFAVGGAHAKAERKWSKCKQTFGWTVELGLDNSGDIQVLIDHSRISFH
jgi:hypothetical protein